MLICAIARLGMHLISFPWAVAVVTMRAALSRPLRSWGWTSTTVLTKSAPSLRVRLGSIEGSMVGRSRSREARFFGEASSPTPGVRHVRARRSGACCQGSSGAAARSSLLAFKSLTGMDPAAGASAWARVRLIASGRSARCSRAAVPSDRVPARYAFLPGKLIGWPPLPCARL